MANRAAIAAKTVELLNAMRAARPLVHNIANYVSMDIAANALLAIGASPAMVPRAKKWREIIAIARCARHQHRDTVGVVGRFDDPGRGSSRSKRQAMGARPGRRRCDTAAYRYGEGAFAAPAIDHPWQRIRDYGGRRRRWRRAQRRRQRQHDGRGARVCQSASPNINDAR